jgi:tetraacyldisaccharide 4'-kinase
MSVRRPWALPLVPLYRAGLAMEDVLRPQPRSLTWPVISVGSLSAGGAGKTPVVIALAELLAAHGWAPDVLSRGYGRDRASNAAAEVQPYSKDAAQRFGDEPTLIALRTGLPVWVDADRWRAGKAAEQRAREHTFSPTTEEADVEASHAPIHLLDDGFQHRRLARDLDLVLVTAEDLEDTLLPADNLREPLQALMRAHAVVLREEEAMEDRVRPLLRAGTPVFHVRRALRFPAPLRQLGAGLRPMAFCGLARPEGFHHMLAAAGCGVLETVAFADHQVYTDSTVDKVIRIAQKLEATGFVTTEKDAVKLTQPLRKRLETVGPLLVVALEASFTEPELVAATMRQVIEDKAR